MKPKSENVFRCLFDVVPVVESKTFKQREFRFRIDTQEELDNLRAFFSSVGSTCNQVPSVYRAYSLSILDALTEDVK